MSRRRRTSVADDLIELSLSLSWKANLIAAAMGWLGLTLIAVVAASVMPPIVAGVAFQVALALRWIVAATFAIGAGVAAWREMQREELHARVAGAASAQGLNEITWQQFEDLVSQCLRREGFSVTQRVNAGADGGVDLAFTRQGKLWLVQCKQRRNSAVGVEVVRAHLGVVTAAGAHAGIVVTSGRFTAEARRFAEGCGMRLIDGQELFAHARDGGIDARIDADAAVEQSAPRCSACASAMTPRVARKGPNAGQQFWGCSRYPACQHTLRWRPGDR